MLELLFGIFALPLIFWAVFLIASVAIIFGSEYEQNYIGALAIAATIVIIWAMSDTPNPLFFLRDHFGAILVFIVGYIALGALWSIAKWKFYNLDRADRFEELAKQYESQYKAALVQADKSINPRTSYKENYAGSLMDFVNEQAYRSEDKFPPNPVNNKTRILGWMGYWPWSAFWTLLRDPLKRIYRHLYEALLRTYHSISASTFKRFEAAARKPVAPLSASSEDLKTP